MSSIERLTGISIPFDTVVAKASHVAAEALDWQEAALVVRAVRGRKTRTVERLFDEFAAALQFPYYFGENWEAFSECIADLDWLPIQPGIVVLVYDADELLADAADTDMTTFVRSLTSAAKDFAEPVEEGEWWDRGPVPFHVVLQRDTIDEFDRWLRAGAELRPLPTEAGPNH